MASAIAARRTATPASLKERQRKFEGLCPDRSFVPVVEFICGLMPAIQNDIYRLMYADFQPHDRLAQPANDAPALVQLSEPA